MSSIVTNVTTVDVDPETLLFTGVDVDDAITKEEDTETFIGEQKDIKTDEPIQGPIQPVVTNDVNKEDESLIIPEQDKPKEISFKEFFKKKLESGEISPFDDYEEGQSYDEYLDTFESKDYDSLWQANIEAKELEVKEKTPQEFFKALPQEFQYAAKYLADGGSDLKGLFKLLAEDQETRELNPESDARSIAKEYLKATTSYTKEEIEETLNDWEDSDKLSKKAQQFKPKLDEISQSRIEQRLAEQQEQLKQKQLAAQQYVQTVQSQLADPVLNGLKITTEKQQEILGGLLSPNYQSLSGKPVNKLGYLLEKYQTTEPNYPLIAEVLWLLDNPEEYKKSIMQLGENKANLNTVRALKTEARNKVSNGNGLVNTNTAPIQRKNNIFKRN